MISYTCADCRETYHGRHNSPTPCAHCGRPICEFCGQDCPDCGELVCDSDECRVREVSGSRDPQDEVDMCGACWERRCDAADQRDEAMIERRLDRAGK